MSGIKGKSGKYRRTENTKEKMKIIHENLWNNLEFKKKMKDVMKGKTGVYKRTDKAKRKMGEVKKGKKRPLFSEKHRKKIGKANSIALKGHKLSKETKIKIREWHINHPNKKFKDTSIELKVEAELQRRNINYQKQVPLCNIAIVDFYLPEYRIVIQCDGNYWHNRIGAKERDERQDKVLIFNGFNVYRFWEHEINESVKNCVNKTLK